MVEFAVVLPVLVVVVFAMIEFDRYLMTMHAMEEAARVGCRTAILEGATYDEVDTEVKGILATFGVSKYDLTITPDIATSIANGDPVTVALNVKYADVSWLPAPGYLADATLSFRSTSLKEH